ncbi:uncharacterized protein SETTUDRAFT_99839, partial [Exserohilum turcica Et28A]
ELSNLINRTTEATKTAIRTCNPTPSIEEAHLPSIDEFVLYVILRSYATVPELIMCLIYLSWFQERLPPGSFIMRPSTPHRVFLAALMMAHKVYNDNSVNNTCWAECSAFPECGFAGFSNVEVNLIEKEFLSFLDWEVHISPDLCPGLVSVVFASMGMQTLHRDCGTASPAYHRATPM